VKIASWNVNSIRARMDHVTTWLKQHQPDVLLMQEMKATEFPSLVFQGLGYESVAVTHPAVLEVAAVAQADERSGEVVALFAVVKPGHQLTEREMIDHCRKSLTGYKVPKHVYFRTELPKTNVGKILRRSLREEISKPAA